MTSEGATFALPAGLATSFCTLASKERAAHGMHCEQNARRLLSWLSDWVPAYARGVFASERTRWEPADWEELERDVVQNTLVAVIRHGSERWALTSDDHALRWTKKVVRNMLVSNGVRWRVRNEASTQLLPVSDTWEPELHERQSFLEFLGLMRREIPALVRPRDVGSAYSLFDELVSSALVTSPGTPDHSTDARTMNRVRQRRRRGRQLAARACHRVAASLTRDSASEICAVAAVLGLESVEDRSR